jgi:glucose/arabinose dehydrogenase
MLTSSDLGIFLIALAGSCCAVTLSLGWQTGWKQAWERLLLVLVVLLVSVMVGSIANRGENVVVQLFVQLAKAGRTQIALLLAGFATGALAALALAVDDRRQQLVRGALLCAALAGFSLLVLKDTLSQYLEIPGATGSSGLGVQRTAVGNFKIQEYATLPISPTSIAVNEQGVVFVAGYSGASFQNGSILRLDKNPQTGIVETKIVATHLNRPHGIAFYQGDLYVSRAGQFSRASNGKLTQENTGAVTRLRDLDADGVYDDYHDILTDLPGAQLPDGLHQNNGIVFNSEGKLFVTIGAPTDHENFSHPQAGTILIANADGSESRVFARGLRNPYDVALGPDDELFCTDNDSNETNTGDEFNHVREGKHYGFPYSTGKQANISGVTQPILLFTSAEGLVYAPPGSLPTGYDRSFYVASYADGNINRISVAREGETYSAKAEFFAAVPSAIDITLAPQGVLYACSHGERKVFVIQAP